MYEIYESVLGQRWKLESNPFQYEDLRTLLANKYGEAHTMNIRHYWPFLQNELAIGIELLLKHIDAGSHIIVLGDYDVDGICGSVIMTKFLKFHRANVTTIIPNRTKDGYGLSEQFIRGLSNIHLLITIDNGTNAISAIEMARLQGIDVIVLDHHNSKQIANPNFIFNPKLMAHPSIEHLCAAGVVFVFLIEVQKYMKKKNMDIYQDIMSLLNLVALATICDVMPLVHLNRALVHRGLELIRNKTHYWSELLVGNIKNIDTSTLGFAIGPYINAAGRFNDSEAAYEFLYTDCKNRQIELLVTLVRYNEQRKEIENEILTNIGDIHTIHPVYIHFSESWPEGLLGVLAARLKDKLQKPVILFTKVKNGFYKASARSMNNFDIGECIESAKHLLISGGGHKMAAGLTLHEENIKEFEQFVYQYYNKNVAETNSVRYFSNYLSIYAIMKGNAYEHVSYFEPYGSSFERPIFFFPNVIIEFQCYINQKHSLFKVADMYNDVSSSFMIFNSARSQFSILRETKVIQCHLLATVFEYNNRISLDVVDIILF